MMSFVAIVRSLLRWTRLYPLLNTYRDKIHYRNWIRAGKPVPPPHLAKQLTVKEFAKRFKPRVFVETGTCRGDMVYAVRDIFDVIYSIELDVELCRNAQKRFAKQRNVMIFQGDSGETLGEILASIKRPCLFWLDGHYSAGFTAKGSLETPIENELRHISGHSLKRSHIVLVDDARCFTGEGDYPSMQSLRDWATNEGFDRFEVRDDIVRIYNTQTIVSDRI